MHNAPQPARGDTSLAFDTTLARLRRFLRRLALVLARGDADVADEMVQEAMIRLWEIDPARYEPADLSFVRGVLRNRMIDVRRRELRGDESEESWLRSRRSRTFSEEAKWRRIPRRDRDGRAR